MHSFFSNKTQPFATANYPTFVAEVASTFNEALLIENMLKTIKDPAARLSLLGNYLENIKGTVFRQTQFAEFELRTHEMMEKGQPLTGEALDALYAEITKKYYGQDKGVCIVDDYVAHEWAFIPHFYRNFYVFQYATSFTASSALSEKVLSGDPAATKRYLTFLGSGGSKYPIDLLKDAGVDMTTDEPLDLTMKKMNRVMDEMDKLLDPDGPAPGEPSPRGRPTGVAAGALVAHSACSSVTLSIPEFHDAGTCAGRRRGAGGFPGLAAGRCRHTPRWPPRRSSPTWSCCGSRPVSPACLPPSSRTARSSGSAGWAFRTSRPASGPRRTPRIRSPT